MWQAAVHGSWSILHTAWGSQVDKKDPLFQTPGICADCQFLLGMTESAKSWAVTVARFPLLQVPPHPAAVTSWGFKVTTPHSTPTSSFCFSPLGSQTWKTRALKNNYTHGENWKVTMRAPGKAQKRPPARTLGLHLRLILGTESAYSSQRKIINKKNNEAQRTPGKGENLIFRVTTLLDSNVQFST